MAEKHVIKALKRELEPAGALVVKIHGGPYQKAGLPDLYVAHRSWTGWLEAKHESSKSDLQRAVMKQLRVRGVEAYFIRPDDSGGWLVEEHDDALVGVARYGGLLAFLAGRRMETATGGTSGNGDGPSPLPRPYPYYR